LRAIICPSILNAKLADLANESRQLLADGADWLHLDVMDGHFVQNISFGHGMVASLRQELGRDPFFDVHMMVEDPGQWLEPMRDAGASQFTFHLEAFDGAVGGNRADMEALHSLIDRVKQCGLRCGLSIKPKTPVEALLKFAAKIDMALIMTVEPGFGGQAFMPEQMEKVRRLRAEYPHLDIQVDGGVGVDNIAVCAAAGANVIVSGTGIIKSKDRTGTIKKLRDVVAEALREKK